MHHPILTPPHHIANCFFPSIKPLAIGISRTPSRLSYPFSCQKNSHSTAAAAAKRSRAATSTTMRSSASYYFGSEYEKNQPFFLDSCFLCHKKLSRNVDIYMYRGDTPFCSQECRQDQIEMDEASEKRLKLSSSKRSNTLRQIKGSTQRCDAKKVVRTGTVAVA